MLAKGVQAYPSQLRNKWESILGHYKKVKDWNNTSGVEPYASLSKADRKLNALPLEFPKHWLDILESFYCNRSSITPPCMAESMLGASSLERYSPPTDDGDDGDFDSTTNPTVQFNSSKRRTKDMSKSATAIVDAMDRFTSSIFDVEVKRAKRDARRDKQQDRQNQFIEEAERKRQEFLKWQHTDMVHE
ncbi:hypothetical protein R1flu_024779 [Riccia fluitans]|uniref:Uncharacterized protein n=1 Tax=Riccia fluitans TaxID=41844 RepID=A0ABD1XVW4_9MARC